MTSKNDNPKPESLNVEDARSRLERLEGFIATAHQNMNEARDIAMESSNAEIFYRKAHRQVSDALRDLITAMDMFGEGITQNGVADFRSIEKAMQKARSEFGTNRENIDSFEGRLAKGNDKSGLPATVRSETLQVFSAAVDQEADGTKADTKAA